ncbi:MAG: hypothetical protein WCH42_05785 [Actinomycetes bacterium]
MFKKIAAVALVGALLTLGMAPSEGATIKSGTACATAGAKTKVGTKSYVCGVNPTVKTAKLTWLLPECLSANKLYLDAVSHQTSFTAQVANTIDQLTKSIASWEAISTLSDQKIADSKATFPAKIAAIQAKIDADTVKLANANAKKATATGKALLDWTKASTGYDSAIKRNQGSIDLLNKTIVRLQATKDRAVSQIASLNAQLASTQSSQPALAAQVKVNVTQSFAQLKLVCKVGL